MFKNMFAHLITLVLGFAAGCTFKELLDKKNPKPMTESRPRRINSPSVPFNQGNAEAKISSVSADFSLQSLSTTFDLYNVRLLNAGSFGILLRRVRSTCYKNILNVFMEKANTPEVLVEMLKSQTTPKKDFVIGVSTGNPYISTDRINDYIIEEGIPISEFNSNIEKVKFLLSLYHTKGIDDFKLTLGSYVSDILSAHEQGEDISEMYNEIMYLVRSRYEYLL